MDTSNKNVLNEYEKATATKAPEKHRIAADYSRFDPRRRVQEAVNAAEGGAPAGEKPAPRAKISLSVIFMYLLIAGFAMLLINSYVRLTVLTDEVSERTEDLQTLQEEHAKLEAENERRYNLSEIEDYAVNVLGMSKLESSQVENIELYAEESIRVIKDEDESGLRDFFSGLLEKLRTALEFLA